MGARRTQGRCGHRPVRPVRRRGDAKIATGVGAPRSTAIRLVDGTRANLHAIIDSFFRRIPFVDALIGGGCDAYSG